MIGEPFHPTASLQQDQARGEEPAWPQHNLPPVPPPSWGGQSSPQGEAHQPPKGWTVHNGQGVAQQRHEALRAQQREDASLRRWKVALGVLAAIAVPLVICLIWFFTTSPDHRPDPATSLGILFASLFGGALIAALFYGIKMAREDDHRAGPHNTATARPRLLGLQLVGLLLAATVAAVALNAIFDGVEHALSRLRDVDPSTVILYGLAIGVPYLIYLCVTGLFSSGRSSGMSTNASNPHADCSMCGGSGTRAYGQAGFGKCWH